MGWCHEFVCQIVPECDHPMTAGQQACTCDVCGAVCTGRFGGCPDVWEQGPKPLHLIDRRLPTTTAAIAPDEEAGGAAMTDESNVYDDPIEEPPAPADPAAQVLAWLRGEFDDVNANIAALSDRLARQEAALLQVTGSQEAELNVSLAELEGCAARLRTEAVTMGGTRAALQEALPGLVADAVGPALASGLEWAVHELRTSVSQLGAALAEALPATIADALAPAMGHVPMVPPAAATAAVAGAGGDEPAGGDIVSQLHEAQDEAAEWFTIVVDEAVRRAVERWMPVPGPAGPGGGAAHEAVAGPAGPADLPAPGAQPGDEAPPAGVAATAEPAAGLNGASDRDQELDARPGSPVACELPGVVVGPTLALGISSALRRARLRDRRRRPAGAPSAGLFHDDPTEGGLSRQLERFALSHRGLAWIPPSGVSPALVVGAERTGEEVPVDLASQPLAVVGPGAADAARALLTTFLATTGPDVGKVITVGDVLPPGPSFPGLERAQSLASALDDLEAEVTRRAASGADLDRGDEDRPTAHTRPLLVLATPRPGALADRLSDLAGRGKPLGVTTVVVGDTFAGAATVSLQPGGVVNTMSSDQGTGDLAGSRLFAIDPEAATELLQVIEAARTDDRPVVADPPDERPFPVLMGSDPAPIQVRVLGQYRIEVGGREIRSGLRAKARELLAFYLLHPEGTTLDVATEALWPEADPGRGSEWFWTALGNLRSLLRRATDTKALKIIERDGDRYRIEPVFEVDLWDFQAALPRAGARTGDPEWAACLQAAADLCRGELLAGADWAWAEMPREDLRRRAIDVLVSLSATRMLAGDVRAALDTLSRAVEMDPLSEQVYRRIMRLHASQSRPDEVGAAFRRLKSRLAEVDLEPMPESERLAIELCG
ncbi:MAG: BTAD domain-containing putative transcriptional regulator [Acidimicrobiales bacterium]